MQYARWSAPTLTVPFTTTLADFKRAIARALSLHDYVPRDVFASIRRGTLRRVLVPVTLHRGTYRAEWTAAVAGGVRSGTLPGRYVIATAQTEGSIDIPSGLAAFAAGGYAPGMERPWSEAKPTGAFTMLAATPSDTWQRDGSKLLDRTAEGDLRRLLRAQAPGDISLTATAPLTATTTHARGSWPRAISEEGRPQSS